MIIIDIAVFDFFYFKGPLPSFDNIAKYISYFIPYINLRATSPLDRTI